MTYTSTRQKSSRQIARQPDGARKPTQRTLRATDRGAARTSPKDAPERETVERSPFLRDEYVPGGSEQTPELVRVLREVERQYFGSEGITPRVLPRKTWKIDELARIGLPGWLNGRLGTAAMGVLTHVARECLNPTAASRDAVDSWSHPRTKAELVRVLTSLLPRALNAEVADHVLANDVIRAFEITPTGERLRTVNGELHQYPSRRHLEALLSGCAEGAPTAALRRRVTLWTADLSRRHQNLEIDGADLARVHACLTHIDEHFPRQWRLAARLAVCEYAAPDEAGPEQRPRLVIHNEQDYARLWPRLYAASIAGCLPQSLVRKSTREKLQYLRWFLDQEGPVANIPRYRALAMIHDARASSRLSPSVRARLSEAERALRERCAHRHVGSGNRRSRNRRDDALVTAHQLWCELRRTESTAAQATWTRPLTSDELKVVAAAPIVPWPRQPLWEFGPSPAAAAEVPNVSGTVWPEECTGAARACFDVINQAIRRGESLDSMFDTLPWPKDPGFPLAASNAAAVRSALADHRMLGTITTPRGRRHIVVDDVFTPAGLAEFSETYRALLTPRPPSAALPLVPPVPVPEGLKRRDAFLEHLHAAWRAPLNSARTESRIRANDVQQFASRGNNDGDKGDNGHPAAATEE